MKSMLILSIFSGLLSCALSDTIYKLDKFSSKNIEEPKVIYKYPKIHVKIFPAYNVINDDHQLILEIKNTGNNSITIPYREIFREENITFSIKDIGIVSPELPGFDIEAKPTKNNSITIKPGDIERVIFNFSDTSYFSLIKPNSVIGLHFKIFQCESVTFRISRIGSE